jgi:glutathione peroxidase
MSAYDFEVDTATGGKLSLADLKGRVSLFVNVASRCGFTPQYEPLEQLYRDLNGDGLEIVGFPCNQFGAQEPGTDAEIQDFCSLTYDVTFPVVAKIDVNGPEAHPLYRYLRAQQPGDFGPDTPGVERLYEHLQRTAPETLGDDSIKWNFTKFLIGRDGRVLGRYESPVTPEQLRPAVEEALAQP